MEYIRLTPIAAESLGVRSLSFYVETPDVNVVVDPGVSLGKRFSRPPHVEEYRALKRLRERLNYFVEKADVLTISHYHFDHFTPIGILDYVWTWNEPSVAQELYRGKVILAKDAKNNINYNQRRRGSIFVKNVENLVKKLEFADGKCFEFGKTKLIFSCPVPHGEDGTRLGWVLMLLIEHADERVVFTSDVQGPVSSSALEQIIKWKPQVVVLGGPPTYLSDVKSSQSSIQQAFKNMELLAEVCDVLIVDHHLLRDENWSSFLSAVYDKAESSSHCVLTVAEYLGVDNSPLECRRKSLWSESPPPEDFVKWCRMPYGKRKSTPPPID
ncbi:MAG: hypothetical protein DRJ31_02280 [Candidatus Methanomethylicota archaeon]|mgnify:FL=1|uniref:UPF0282 protein DRJ31_02280 n=1 Tax=Thermoproteota archaeon TaxID=2056631 RepID=A0A497ESI3_9CREN|nr:MAG: hypothetical protein DRJ31_02280 [Candidatus Verstraetearchaeota archaeon]